MRVSSRGAGAATPEALQVDLAALAEAAGGASADVRPVPGPDAGPDPGPVPGPDTGPAQEDMAAVQPRLRPRSARALRRTEAPPDAPQVASAALWSGTSGGATPAADLPPAADPFGPAPTARFVRSSALFTSDDPDEPSPAAAAAQPEAGAGLPDAVPEDPVDVEATIAEMVQTSRTETRRRRARFPKIEPDDADREGAGGGDRARAVAEAGRLAARALAALLRGAPPDGVRPGD
jgi:hypothetical protein